MIIVTLAMSAMLAVLAYGVAVTAGHGCKVGAHDLVGGRCLDCGHISAA